MAHDVLIIFRYMENMTMFMRVMISYDEGKHGEGFWIGKDQEPLLRPFTFTLAP